MVDITPKLFHKNKTRERLKNQILKRKDFSFEFVRLGRSFLRFTAQKNANKAREKKNPIHYRPFDLFLQLR